MAFFTLMGGFLVERMVVGAPSQWDDVEIESLCRYEMIQQVPDHPFNAMPAGPPFEKLLAILQVGAILLECLGRQLQQLHITIIEIHTVIHVILAIVMYAIWKEKPFDSSDSIGINQLDSNGDMSAAILYIDSLRQKLNKAEAEISPRILALASVDEKLRSPFIEHREMVAAIAVLRSIKECPEEAERRFKASQYALKQYFIRAVRRDVKWAVRNYIRMPPEIPRQIQLVANAAAFNTAHEEA
jgi:hypothetical protein